MVNVIEGAPQSDAEEMADILKRRDEKLKAKGIDVSGVAVEKVKNVDEDVVEPEVVEPEVVDDEELVVEDNSESEDEFEQDEEVAEVTEEESFKKKYLSLKESSKKKGKSLYAERHKAQQEVIKTQRENERLTSMISNTVDSNSVLYARDLESQLVEANNLKSRLSGLPDNDELKLEADKVYTRLLHRTIEFENSKYGGVDNSEPEYNNEPVQQYQNEPVQQYQEAAPSYERQLVEKRLSEWLDDNPELIAETYSYDPKLEKEVKAFMGRLDKKYNKSSRGGETITPDNIEDYLEEIDDFTAEVKSKQSKGGYKTSNVAGVRAKSPGTSGKSAQIRLTDEQKLRARGYGITDEEFIQVKLRNAKILKDNKGVKPRSRLIR